MDLSKVQAVFSDIDGTLLDSHSVLREKTIESVSRLKIPFFLASGRYYKMMSPLAKELHINTPFVSANGGLIIRNFLPESVFTFMIRRTGTATPSLLLCFLWNTEWFAAIRISQMRICGIFPLIRFRNSCFSHRRRYVPNFIQDGRKDITEEFIYSMKRTQCWRCSLLLQARETE